MKNKTAFSLFIFLLVLAGCKSQNQRRQELNNEFITKYGETSFNEFKGRSFLVRGFDKGNPIVFVYDNLTKNTTGGCLFYGVTIDKKNLQVIKTSRNALADSCIVDETLCKKLALKFIVYDVAYLQVDSNGNVFVRTHYNERPADLIRFVNPKFITDKYRKNWKQRDHNWYERIED